MRGIIRAVWIGLAAIAFGGCQWMPQPKDVDQGKADRAMEQVEKGDGS